MQRGIAHGQDLSGQPGRIARPGLVQSHRSHRKAGRHLHGGEKRVHTGQAAAGHRDADHRPAGARGNGPGQMRGHARGADKDPRAPGFLVAHQGFGALRRPVGRTHGKHIVNAQAFQHVHAGADFFLVGLGPHQNNNMRHDSILFASDITVPGSGPASQWSFSLSRRRIPLSPMSVR